MFFTFGPVGDKAGCEDMGWVCYGRVNRVTGGGAIIRELPGVNAVTGH